MTYASLPTILSSIEVAAHQGEHQKAYQLSTEATRLAPRNAEAWLWRAETANNVQEKGLFLCRALLLNPKHPIAQRRMHKLLQLTLEHDACLAYVDETDTFYRVRTGAGQPLIVPKGRAVSTSHLPGVLSPLQPALNWLGLTLLGLLLAGLGTLVCAPVAILLALRARKQPLSRPDATRVKVVLAIAVLLWLCGLLLSTLLFIHM